MSDDAQFIHAHMVRFERMLDADPARVWHLLTDTRALPAWYGEGTIQDRVGGRVELMGGHVRGTVTQWVPSRKLVYSWNVFGPGQSTSDYPESYLTLTLAPQGEGTRLTLEHLPILEEFVKLNAMGWHTYLDMVSDAAAGRTIHSRETYMDRNARKYGIDVSKLKS
jgi:uncharacterized protein YndB with AHSA1/START domain